MIGNFVAEMRRYVPDEARVLCCQFRGDPEADFKGKWRARVVSPAADNLDEAANVYLCVSAMRKNERGEFRRRKENFAGGILLMIDDLGSGPGAKFPLSLVSALPPTALIETSPQNYQAIYMFDELITDMEKFEALINAFIKAQFLGRDTGMAGVNRVFRPPAGVNGKPKYGGWRVRLAQWHPERRYSIARLAAAFGLNLAPPRVRPPRGATEDKAANIRAFIDVRNSLREAAMIKSHDHDLAGWADVVCPWTHEHTGMKNNGAAIRLPHEDNSFYGAFKCHHGACEERGWRHLTDWLAMAHEDHLEDVNAQAGEWHERPRA